MTALTVCRLSTVAVRFMTDSHAVERARPSISVLHFPGLRGKPMRKLEACGGLRSKVRRVVRLHDAVNLFSSKHSPAN